jgi:hypothetical protein
MLKSNWFNLLRNRRKKVRSRRLRQSGSSLPAHWVAECLEARALLSNVTVTIDQGTLDLVGDADDHTFDVSVVGTDLELAGSAGTTFTFNGTTNATVDVPLASIASIKTIAISMQGGDDTISVDATDLGTISAEVDVVLGDGTNSFTLTNATATGQLVVVGGSGDDTVSISDSTLHTVVLFTGAGDDTVDMSSVTLQAGPRTKAKESADVAAQLDIDTGDGDDTVTLTSVTEDSAKGTGAWLIRTGKGNDSVSLHTVETQNRTRVVGGGGDDTFTTTDSTFTGVARFVGTSGNDQISVDTSSFNNRAFFRTGGGDTQNITVTASTFEKAVHFEMAGKDAVLDVESGTTADAGTTFHGRVVARLTGPSAVANFGDSSSGNTLVFDKRVIVIGGIPKATVNIAGTGVTIGKHKLLLILATKHTV